MIVYLVTGSALSSLILIGAARENCDDWKRAGVLGRLFAGAVMALVWPILAAGFCYHVARGCWRALQDARRRT